MRGGEGGLAGIAARAERRKNPQGVRPAPSETVRSLFAPPSMLLRKIDAHFANGRVQRK